MAIDWNSANLRPADFRDSLLALQMASDSSKDAFKTFKEGLKEHQTKVRSMNEAKLKEHILNGGTIDGVNSAERKKEYEELKASMKGEYDLNKVLENKANALKYLNEKEEADRSRKYTLAAHNNQELLNNYREHLIFGIVNKFSDENVLAQYNDQTRSFEKALYNSGISLDTLEKVRDSAIGFASKTAGVTNTMANTDATLAGTQLNVHNANQVNRREDLKVGYETGANSSGKDMEYMPYTVSKIPTYPILNKYLPKPPTDGQSSGQGYPQLLPQPQEQKPAQVEQASQENAWNRFNKFYNDKGNSNPFPAYNTPQYGILG